MHTSALPRPRRVFAIAVAATALLGAAIVGSPSAHADTVPTVVTGVLEDTLNTLGTTTESATYGGLTASTDGTSLTIYLTNLDPVVEAAFTVLAPTGALTFASTPNSLASLDGLHQTLQDNWDSLISAGVDVNWFDPNQATGREDIGVVNLNDAATAALDNLLGVANINVVNVTPDEAAAITPSVTRTSDSSPFNGGDSVASSTSLCTTGFGVTIGGYKRLLTAAHCFAPGTAVRNSQYSSGGTSMGSAVARDISFHESGNVYTGTDTEYLSGAGSRLVFLGGVSTSTTGTVAGRLGNYVGDQICQSGQTSGEICGLVIKSTNGCQTFSNEDGTSLQVCSLVKVHRSSGSANNGGDSGGPNFRFSGSSLYASGTTTGGNGSAGDGWFTDISADLSIWHATLNT